MGDSGDTPTLARLPCGGPHLERGWGMGGDGRVKAPSVPAHLSRVPGDPRGGDVATPSTSPPRVND